MSGRKDLANALRALAMDAIEKAKSGHPGAPMGMADIAEVLWNDFLVHNPANPSWHNRDRFVLSNGHASMLLYGLLHLSGYDLSLDEIKNFRQLGSKTPGHPEHGLTPGVEVTTGPLGQGIASAVGMALAEKLLAGRFNKEKFPLVDHFTYVFLGDGCLMEGISHEACSLAGTLGLGKLIAFWDDNGISIDGPVSGWFTDDTAERFKAYGWHVVSDVDGHDAEAVKKAVVKARKVKDKPSLICCKTTIAYGSPTKAGKSSSHGSPLGESEVAGARKLLGWKYGPFEIPSEIRKGWDARLKGEAAEKKWNKLFASYSKAFPDDAAEYSRRMQGNLAESINLEFSALLGEVMDEARKSELKEATRNSSLAVLNRIAPFAPELFGGSADLSGSVGLKWKGCSPLAAKPGEERLEGDYLHYGVREFAMGAIMNGLSLHGGFIPYGGTFLIFSDYAKNAIRLSALMNRHVLWVLTHDSIGVGEDGPTHQPVEQLAGLRYIPGLHVWRPCDKIEAIAAWRAALERAEGPSCFSMSRQDLPVLPRPKGCSPEKTLEQIRRGGYVLQDCNGRPDAIIIATGSEVAVALQAADLLAEKKLKIRVVSMPCAELFDAQSAAWKESVLPDGVRARVAVEAASADFWRKYVGLDGKVIGMYGFGESAPGKVLFDHFGFTAENVAKVTSALTSEKAAG